MKEQIIKFKTAKLAKQKGFNQMKANIYGDNLHYNKDDPDGEAVAKQGNVVIGWYLAPTQSLLQKWLREKHEIYIYVLPNRQHGVIKWVSNHSIRENIHYDTYEEALEEGLYDSLKLIKC